MSTKEMEMPRGLARVPAERVIELDVREDLRNGREPFSRIMTARERVPPGVALRVRAIFEPVPLYRVMRKQGFEHWTERLAEDDWRISFYPAEDDADGGGDAGADGPYVPRPAEADAVVVLDVRGMEPPEPMVRTLAALESLEPGATLLQINERVPRFLLPKLEALGFVYHIREEADQPFRVFISRRAGS